MFPKIHNFDANYFEVDLKGGLTLHFCGNQTIRWEEGAKPSFLPPYTEHTHMEKKESDSKY